MSELREPIIILSDLHIGLQHDLRVQIQSLRAVWRGAGTVIFNGDTMNASLARAPRGANLLEEIKQCCIRDGAEPIIIGGNADFPRSEHRYACVADRRILVLHGDLLLRGISPWRPDAKKIRKIADARRSEMDPETLKTFEGQIELSNQVLSETHRRGLTGVRPGLGSTFQRQLAFLKYWFAQPLALFHVVRTWLNIPRRASEFLRRYAPTAEVIIIGHSHRAGMWRIGDYVVINTGSFQKPSRPHIVRYENGHAELLRLSRTNDGFEIRRRVAHHTLR